jgi:hypothetical protein
MGLNVFITKNYVKFTLLEGTKKQSQFEVCPFEFLRAGSERSRMGQFVFVRLRFLSNRWGLE